MRHPSAVGRKFRDPKCPRGHDKREVGVYGYHCRACRAETRRRYVAKRKPYSFVEPFCVNGHDKRVVGVRSDGACAECHRIRDRRYNRAKAMGNPNSEIFAQPVPHLKLVRTELGLSMAQFAKEVGVCRRTLGRWEAGEHGAKPRNLAAILEVISPRLRERKYEEAGL